MRELLDLKVETARPEKVETAKPEKVETAKPEKVETAATRKDPPAQKDTPTKATKAVKETVSWTHLVLIDAVCQSFQSQVKTKTANSCKS